MWGATRSRHQALVQMQISIHAPMWGATTVTGDFLEDVLFISIHAPMWGATGTENIDVIEFDHFNPRTHVGCD